MKITKEPLTPTSVKLTIISDQKAIDSIKRIVVEKLSEGIKLPGFREGKAPANMVEKQIDQSLLQNEFLNEAMNQFYAQAVKQEGIRVVKEPVVAITKFVPYTTLEFTAQVEAIGDIKLGDYKSITVTPKKINVSKAEIDQVLENLRDRASDKKNVNRAAKSGDEANIDFKGIDSKTKDHIEGADGKDYPLVLGSQSFIPGFEEEVIGLKTGDKKTFDIVFPADYNVSALKKRKVNFTITVNTVKELTKPKLDDKFAASVGPFNTVEELKSDIKRQLEVEKRNEVEQELNNQVLEQLADKSQVAIPDSIVEEEIDRLEEEEKRNLTYRGQTWQEHLDQEGVTGDAHRTRQKPLALTRIKTGLLIGEVSEREDIRITPEELDRKILELKSQYTDKAMQAELDKPDNQRDIYSRAVIEKTIKRLRELSSKNQIEKKPKP
jgi:trigger factor